jgi:hypothetical protein
MYYIGSNVQNWPLEGQRALADGHEICVRKLLFLRTGLYWFLTVHCRHMVSPVLDRCPERVSIRRIVVHCESTPHKPTTPPSQCLICYD